MKIFIVGSLNMDLVISAPFLPEQGMTITGSGFMTNAGGKGGNQAAACAKLGGNAHMVGCVGEAFGEELLSALHSSGADTRFVERRNDVSSGIAVILVIDGDNRIILDKGANGKVSFGTVDRSLSEAERGDFLVLQLEIGMDIVEYALRKGKELGMVTLLNPAPAAALPEGMLALCDYFIPNQTEAQFYTGIYPDGEESLLACAEALKGKGVENVIITLGSRGSAYVGKEGFFTVKAFPAKAVDTTAAGDTFVGGLAVRLAEGASVKDAMTFASKASSLTVTRRGAQQSIPTREEVEATFGG